MQQFFMRVLLFFFSFSSLLLQAEEPATQRKRIALMMVATGRYDHFAEELIQSARPYFCKNHDVTYFVFTDGKVSDAPDVVKVFQKRLGWPYDSMMRFHIYAAHKELFDGCDYLYAIDADMRFASDVGDEILGDLVATIRPDYVGKRGPYERKALSAACVTKKEGTHYFAGGFYGGKPEEFFKLLDAVIGTIDRDLKIKYVARWHDESHLNRYLINHPPSIILSPAYCHPEWWKDFPYEKKLLCLFKDVIEYRAP